MNNFAIQCSKLTKHYKENASNIEVLHQIDLDVNASEMVAIVGASGSGKSTLLHLLGGLDKPTSGAVSIGGKDLTKLSESEKCHLRNQNLGFVYQFHHLLPEFSALENVCMVLLIRNMKPKMAQSKAEHLLDLVGLKNRLHHKIGELSGGERQRVAIARALVADPMCVLADEPTGNLDPRNAEKVLDLFFNLQQTYKTSVVMVTHDMAIAKRAQRVLKLEKGQLIQV